MMNEFKNLIPENALSIDGYGSRIFFINTEELTYDLGAKQFEKWLFLQKLIEPQWFFQNSDSLWLYDVLLECVIQDGGNKVERNE